LRPIKKIKESLPSSSDSSEKNETTEIPRITNDTVSIHREDVLKGARKYIYPLSHSKHRIVVITTSLVLTLIILFFGYCTLALYKFNTTSQFLYRVTTVIPFPIARVDGHFVSYNNYLFEIEHFIHYYQTQQGVDFNSASGKQQLLSYKKEALTKVINDSYIADLARQYHVTVSDSQINEQINIVRSENRLGDNQAELADVLKNFYGWSINDFKRELRTQILAQNVVAKLDTGTEQEAKSILSQLNSGTSFATLASQYSDDASTKGNGGQYQGLISKNDLSVPAQVVMTLFNLKPGQISGIINTGYSLEIVKNNSEQNGQIQASHIQLNFKDISTYLSPLESKSKEKVYVNF
jgi:hypothetical protein